MPPRKPPDSDRLDRVVAEARRQREAREHAYREAALRLLPWVCARCGRAFERGNLHELTVHHRDHDHEHNPPDGSNWELLCLYCHDNEHRRWLDALAAGAPPSREETAPRESYRPFADLQRLLGSGEDEDSR